MIRILDFTKPFEVHIDVNDFVIGKVFMQNGYQIAFETKKFLWRAIIMANSWEGVVHCCVFPESMTTLFGDA